MRISELATQSRKRLADKRLVDTSILQRMLDEAIIDAYIACADCGKRQVDDAAVLARFVEEADSAETFLNLVEAHSHPKHKSIFGRGERGAVVLMSYDLLGRLHHQYVRV